MKVVHDGLAVCGHCLAYIANGQVEDDGRDITSEHAARMRAQWGDELQHMVASDSESSEGWFSWSSCDGCEDSDGGQRYPAAVLGPDDEPTQVRRQYARQGLVTNDGPYAEDDADEVAWFTVDGNVWLAVSRSPRWLWQIETSDYIEIKISYCRKRFRTLRDVFAFAEARAGAPVVEVEEW